MKTGTCVSWLPLDKCPLPLILACHYLGQAMSNCQRLITCQSMNLYLSIVFLWCSVFTLPWKIEKLLWWGSTSGRGSLDLSWLLFWVFWPLQKVASEMISCIACWLFWFKYNFSNAGWARLSCINLCAVLLSYSVAIHVIQLLIPWQRVKWNCEPVAYSVHNSYHWAIGNSKNNRTFQNKVLRK